MTTRSLSRFLPFALLPLLAAPLSAAVPRATPAATPTAASTASSTPSAVRGQYVEARTASVFAGACHYNGERVTEGRSAVLAWDIQGGTFDGVDLTGVKLMAVVSGEQNLADADAGRRTEIVVDAGDKDGQAARVAAAVAWAKAKCGDQLGTIVSAKAGRVTARRDSGETLMSAAGFASIDVRPMPDKGCCAQPHLVWYTPIMPIDDRRVGYTQAAGYAAGRVGDTWQRSDENSAIYGTFGG